MLNKANKSNLIGGKKSLPPFLRQYRHGGIILNNSPSFASPASMAIAREEKKSKYLK